jgi:hypothetical protein
LVLAARLAEALFKLLLAVLAAILYLARLLQTEVVAVARAQQIPVVMVVLVVALALVLAVD